MSRPQTLPDAVLELLGKRYNLVTNEEFLAQSRLLEQSLARINKLESQVAQLVSQLEHNSDTPNSK